MIYTIMAALYLFQLALVIFALFHPSKEKGKLTKKEFVVGLIPFSIYILALAVFCKKIVDEVKKLED